MTAEKYNEFMTFCHHLKLPAKDIKNNQKFC